MGLVLVILGGCFGVAGFLLYEKAEQIIGRGDTIWGMGGLAFVGVGVILVTCGLIYQLKRKD